MQRIRLLLANLCMLAGVWLSLWQLWRVFWRRERPGLRWSVGILVLTLVAGWWLPPRSMSVLWQSRPAVSGLGIQRLERGPVWGHRVSLIYHWSACPNYPQPPVNLQRWRGFGSAAEAERAGYVAAKNCR